MCWKVRFGVLAAKVIASLDMKIICALTVILVTLSGHGAWSQSAKTIKIIVPYPAGGIADILARLLADQIGRMQGPAMIVENRPGASGDIGTEIASRAAPDGNTLMINGNPLVINPQLRKLAYDPMTNFESICYLTNTPTLFVVNSASPYQTLADLLDTARAKPGILTLAGIGPASASHIAFEMLKRTAHVDMTFVPYPGAAPAVNALLGEHVTSALVNYTDAGEQLKAGRLRALATASRMRIEPLPNVPTVAESGYKDYEVEIWFGLFAPAKTPNEMVSQIAGRFTTALQASAIKSKLAVQGLYPVGICGADFGVFIRKQYTEYERVIRDSNIKAE